MRSPNGPLRIGIGGPVGAGKTTLTASLCRALRDKFSICVVTNDIYTQEDAEALVRMQARPSKRIKGVETGGCPHTARRETRPSILRQSKNSARNTRMLILCLWNRAVTISLQHSRQSSRTSPFMSLTLPQVTTFLARAGPLSPDRIYLSSIKQTSHHM